MPDQLSLSKQHVLLEAFRENLPAATVHFTQLDSPPMHVELLRLSRAMVELAQANHIVVERGNVDEYKYYSSTDPVSALLGKKFSRLDTYFEGLTVGDIAQLPIQDLLMCAAPTDRMHMHLFIAKYKALLTETHLRSQHRIDKHPTPAPVATAVAATDVDVDLSRRFVGSDMSALTMGCTGFSADKFQEAVLEQCGGNLARIRSINVSGSLLNNKDYKAICDLVCSNTYPNLTRLLLVGCRRLCRESDTSDACETTVRLLRENSCLKLVTVYDTAMQNIDNKEWLFDELNDNELCRLIWMSESWCKVDDSDDDEGEPIYYSVLRSRERVGIELDAIAQKVMEAHREYYEVWGNPC